MSKYSEEFKLKVSEKNQAREQEKVIVINDYLL